MGNKNYIKGRAKEYRIVNSLKASGYDIAQRSAGSHSPIDVWAISKVLKTIVLIQVKPKSMSKKAKKKLEKEYEWLNDKFEVQFAVV